MCNYFKEDTKGLQRREHGGRRGKEGGFQYEYVHSKKPAHFSWHSLTMHLMFIQYALRVLCVDIYFFKKMNPVFPKKHAARRRHVDLFHLRATGAIPHPDIIAAPACSCSGHPRQMLHAS
jgi:hypothetical protein